MPTKKKRSSAKMKTKAKTRRGIAKTKPKRQEKKIAAKMKTKVKARAAPKGKAQSKAKARPKAKLALKAKARPKAKAALKAKVAPIAKATVKAKAAPKVMAKPKAIAVKKLPPRRDATGHLDPKYARELRARSREGQDDSNNRAFFETPRSGDDLAQELGEEAVATMTSGEDQGERLLDVVEEERGGPFIKTRGADEYAGGTDRSNPRGATREPFPKT